MVWIGVVLASDKNFAKNKSRFDIRFVKLAAHLRLACDVLSKARGSFMHEVSKKVDAL
jgi:hypothetical protein